MRLLAIDFGTSNTVAALSVDGQAPRTVTFDASPLLPSSVYIAADGQVVTGREAQRQARLDPTRYEANPKRRIDDGEVLLGDRVVHVIDLIAAVLRTVGTEVRRQLGGAAPDQVRLTHPAQWGATRQNTLVTAARAAGLGTHLVLIPEPVAAAAQFTQLPGRALPPGGSVAIYDLGGGTFDIAVVGRTPANAASSSEFHVLAEAGLADLGGLDFDQAVLDHVGRATSASDPGRWQQILRPKDASGRRAARAMAEDVRAAKETLSRYPQTEVALPDPFTDAHLTRSEFEGLIRPNLLRSIEVLSTTLHTAGVAPDRLTGIFLVGGSSRIPLVAKLIGEQLGVTPVALDQPETAVALGALLVPVSRDGNRTVAVADQQDPRRPGSVPGPVSTGPPPPTGPHASGRHLLSGQQSAGTAAGATPPTPGRQQAAASRKRTRLLVAAGVAVLAVAVVLIVVFTRGGDTPVAGTSTGSTPSVATTPAGSTPGPATTATTGLGPGGLFGSSEMSFLGPSIGKAINCGDNTQSFNDVVSANYQGVKVIRCEVAEPDRGRLSGRTLIYIITTTDPAAAGTLLDQITRDRQTDDYGLSKNDSEEKFTGGAVSGRVVTAYQIPAIGRGSNGTGASALGWMYDGQPYVGLVVPLNGATSDDLMDYWTQNYKPRG